MWLCGIRCQEGGVAALKANSAKINYAVTVFPGVDEEATEALQHYLQPNPLSSPLIAIIKDGEIIHCLERHKIKGYPVEDIAEAVQKGIELTTGHA